MLLEYVFSLPSGGGNYEVKCKMSCTQISHCKPYCSIQISSSDKKIWFNCIFLNMENIRFQFELDSRKHRILITSIYSDVTFA
jgi:hypothetical protein